MLARLREDDDGDVLRDQVLVDQNACEVEVRLGRRREPDLDLLEAEPHEQVEHAPLARAVHRVDQRLVAVAQVDASTQRGARSMIRDGQVRSGRSTVGYGRYL